LRGARRRNLRRLEAFIAREQSYQDEGHARIEQTH
jgi:hypothetical protein